MPEWPGEPRSPPGLPSDAPDHVWLDDECAGSPPGSFRESLRVAMTASDAFLTTQVRRDL